MWYFDKSCSRYIYGMALYGTRASLLCSVGRTVSLLASLHGVSIGHPPRTRLPLPHTTYTTPNLSNDVQSPRPSAASLRETSDKLPRGMRMYARYAELDHLPRILMTASSTPAVAADVAAPMRKLCQEYGAGSTPTDDNASLIRLTST